MLQRIFSFGRQAAHPSDGGNPYDRMSVVTWVLVFGLILSLLVEAPATLVKFTALGSPVALEFSAGRWCWPWPQRPGPRALSAPTRAIASTATA